MGAIMLLMSEEDIWGDDMKRLGHWDERYE